MSSEKHPQPTNQQLYPHHPDRIFWRQRIEEWYPRWRERTYFIPPVYMCKTLSKKVQLCGQTVQVPSLPVSKPVRGSKTVVLASDVIEDQTQQRLLHCFHKLSDVQSEAMFVLSKLEYQDYLNEPCFASAARTLPRPVDLEKEGKHRGDFDVLVIHRRLGLLTCEIKSVGSQFSRLPLTEKEEEVMIVGRVKLAVKQLLKSGDVLTHLVSDMLCPPRVRKTLVLPFVLPARLRKVLVNHPQLKLDLCHCLGIRATEDPVRMCVTSDHVPNMATPFDVAEDVCRRLRDWWQFRMSRTGNDPAMCDSVYLELLARFCGPATTVRVFCTAKPRLHLDIMRTEGEGASETGKRFTQIMLTPEQVALQNSQESLVILTGPPGTGKSLMLILKALDWLRHGHHVQVVSTWNQSLAMSFNIVHQVRQTADESAAEKVHLHVTDLLRGQEGVNHVVNELVEALNKVLGEPLYVIIDEAFDGPGRQFTDLCSTLHERVPGLHLWAACMHHGNGASFFKEVPLTQPLRTPPIITHEVQLSNSMKTGSVYPYEDIPYPLPSDGPAVIYLNHSGGHGCEEIRHCELCGRNIAKLLREDLHVGTSGKTSTTRRSPLHFKDVFVLSYYALGIRDGLVAGLQEGGVPVNVLKSGDLSGTKDVARMVNDEVVVTHCTFVSGLERKVVVWLQGDRSDDGDDCGQAYDEQYGRLYAMSRCTAQLVCVRLESFMNAKIFKKTTGFCTEKYMNAMVSEQTSDSCLDGEMNAL